LHAISNSPGNEPEKPHGLPRETHLKTLRKIAFIAASELTPWGGSELCWSAAAERFAKQGVQVHVSAMEWDRPVKQIEHLRSVGCRIFLRHRRSLPERMKRRFLMRNKFELHHMRQIGAGTDLVVISQGGNTDGLPWMEAAREQGFKYAIISESANEQWWPNDSVAERLAACYEAACAAFFVSAANLALSRRQFVTPLTRGRVIRNPVNVRYDARPAWPGDPSESLFLASVARLDPFQKGQDLLLEVLAQAHWRARNVHVTFVGTGQNERALPQMAKKLDLSRVAFAGFVEDIEQLWARHHALVLPSRFEGMPLSVVEAMLCGRPCIATDVGGNRELIRDGINGFLARAPTVELLEEAMNRAWESQHRLREMGEMAATDARRWVSPDPTGDFVREVESLVDGASG
jgi:glycosyltransferase involved in cell wall biosynthesis